MARTFYRVVRTNPPTRTDFLSNDAKGREPRDRDPEILRLWDGLSVYDSATRARQQARRYRGMGRFIAALTIDDGDTIRLEKTMDDPRHYTLWGSPEAVLALMTGIEPV